MTRRVDFGFRRLADRKVPAPPKHLSADQLAALRTVLRDQQFCSLGENYGAMVVDGPVRRISSRCGSTIKTVKILSLESDPVSSSAEPNEIKRVLRVWIAIRSLV